MLTTLAVANYRSINAWVVPLERLNVFTGPNGSGKSNLYRALRLLAEMAQDRVINALTREGGLNFDVLGRPGEDHAVAGRRDCRGKHIAV